MFVKRQHITVDNQFVDRIITEHDAKVSIAVDFDDTVTMVEKDQSKWAVMRPIKNCFDTLRKWRDFGCRIYLDTRRRGGSLEIALAWCANCKFVFDGVVGGNREIDPPSRFGTVFRVDDMSLGTPLMHDKNDVYRDHVDWKALDETMTPMLKELTDKIKERKKNFTNYDEEICFY